MNDGVVVGIFVTLWVIRELIPLMLRLQQRRRSDPPPPPATVPPVRTSHLSSPELPDVSVGELLRASQRTEQKIDRLRSIIRDQPKEVQDAIRRHLESDRVSRPDLFRRRVDDDE